MSENNGKARKRVSGMTLPQQMKAVAELEVRRYFDHYLEKVFPVQIAAIVKAHDEAEGSHGGVRRIKWVLAGAIAVGVAGGAGIERLIGLVL